jgi:MFS superfamily sulfate permease-like transporter
MMTVAEKIGTKPRRNSWVRFVPIIGWLPGYDRAWLSFDIIAGLTLWGLIVPEAMAYAGIAGLPPQAGLYTLVASLLIYALLGTARHLSVGPTSATSALLASSVATALVATAAANASDPATYQAYATAFVLITGLIFLAAGLARLGFITQFLSKPVMDGFVLGLALFVVTGQLNKLFGVAKPEGNTVERLVGIIKELPQANWVTFAVGASALALLFLLPRLNKKIPAGLVVLFGYILLSFLLKLEDKYGVAVVGTLPQGLPSLTIPKVPFTAYLSMVLPAIGVLLVAFSEAVGVAHEFAEKHGYDVNADQELSAHALVNLGSALVGYFLKALATVAGIYLPAQQMEQVGVRPAISLAKVAWLLDTRMSAPDCL